MSYADIHNIGGDDEGLDGGTALNGPTDNGGYYTFDGVDQGIYWGSDWGNETTIDGIKARVRFTDFNSVSGNNASTIWKSGGNVNGIGLGIDKEYVQRIGIFGIVGSARTSITIDRGLLEENVWYIIYATPTKLTIQKESDSTGYTKTGTVTPGNGSGNESIGCSYGTCPIAAGNVRSYFSGDIDYVEIYTDGSLTPPDLTTAPDAEVAIFEFGSSRGGDESLAHTNTPTEEATYYTFNGTDEGLYRSFDFPDEISIDIYAKFRPHDKDSGNEQTIWKSGGYTNGIAIGIDASGNLGIFGRSGGSLTSIVIATGDYSDDTWYELRASKTRIQLKNVATEAIVENTGTCTPGNGADYISWGRAATNCVISGDSGGGDNFDGDIADVSIFTEGAVDWIAAGWTGKICGVTNPSKICGIDVADIAKVSGV